jgi:hypothetical protein
MFTNLPKNKTSKVSREYPQGFFSSMPFSWTNIYGCWRLRQLLSLDVAPRKKFLCLMIDAFGLTCFEVHVCILVSLYTNRFLSRIKRFRVRLRLKVEKKFNSYFIELFLRWERSSIPIAKLYKVSACYYIRNPQSF